MDKGSEPDTSARLLLWHNNFENIRVVDCGENLNFALGCNLGFRESRGGTVIFLNNDTEVCSGWLGALVEPLRAEPMVGAVQPKLLYPDQTVQCAGIGFPPEGTLAYPIYQHVAADAASVCHRRHLQAVTAACVAMRAADFAALRGFDPIFVNGQEDVDLCLRMRESLGKLCLYEPGATVIHHESKTPGRGARIRENRAIFAGRWQGRIRPDLDEIYASDGYRVGRYGQTSRTVRTRAPPSTGRRTWLASRVRPAGSRSASGSAAPRPPSRTNGATIISRQRSPRACASSASTSRSASSRTGGRASRSPMTSTSCCEACRHSRSSPTASTCSGSSATRPSVGR